MLAYSEDEIYIGRVLVKKLLVFLSLMVFSLYADDIGQEIAHAFNNLEKQLTTLHIMLAELQPAQEAVIFSAQFFQELPENVPFVEQFQVTSASSASVKDSVFDQLINQTTHQLKLLWDSFSWDEFKKQIKKDQETQYGGLKASVEQGIKLTSKGNLNAAYSDEAKYLEKRLSKSKLALEKFINVRFDSVDTMPRIGCAFSGGGYRAMIATAGFLKALEDMQLLDGILYVSALSGSTWALGPWILQQNPNQGKNITMQTFNQMLLDKINKNHFNLLSAQSAVGFNARLFASDILWPKIVFEKVINSVDLYGSLLAHFLLADFDQSRHTQRLSNQLIPVLSGNVPWPMYTSVSMHKINNDYLYNWYEFNPEEIRNLELNCAIPSFAFNRKFDNGNSINTPPQESFGFLMGIFGSAYSFNLADIKKMMFGSQVETDEEKELVISKAYNQPMSWAKQGIYKLKNIFSLGFQGKFSEIWQQTKNDIVQIQAALLTEFLDFVVDTKLQIGDVKLGTARVAPAQIHNPFKNYATIAQPWLQARDYLIFIDAGLAYNIPVRPLFRPERSLDLVIIGDFSGDIPTPSGSQELAKSLADIKRFYGVDYEKDMNLSKKVMSIYRPKQTTYIKNVDPKLSKVRPPIILYINFLKDDALISAAKNDKALQAIINEHKLNDFSAENCVSTYCDTFNFNYTAEQFKQLNGIAQFNIRSYEGLIKSLIEERVQLLVEYPEFGA